MNQELMTRARAAYPTFAMLVIVLILFLQTLAVIKPIRWATWPFTNYPMYKTPHYDGDSISVSILVFAELSGGVTVEILPRDVGLSWFKFYEHAKCVIPNNDSCPEPAAYVSRLIELYEPPPEQEILKLIAMSYPAVISQDGVVKVDSVVLGETSIAESSRQK